MAVSLKHAFTSNVADSGDPNLVQPSNWNAEHTLTAGADTLLGAISAGSVVEIPCTAAGRAILDDADAAAQRTTLGLGTGDSPTFTGLTLSGVGSFSAGTALLPSLTTTGDTNTGMWFPAADTIAWSTGGSERIRINSSGFLGIGTSNPTVALDIRSSTAFQPQILAVNTRDDAFGPYWNSRKLRGSAAANSGDYLGTFMFQSADTGGTIRNALWIEAKSQGAGAAYHSGYFDVNVTSPAGAFTNVFQMSSDGVRVGPTGTVSLPSISIVSDPNTGIWFPAADTIAFSEGGAEAARINSSGQFLVGGTTADAKLTVTGVGTTSTTPSTTADIGATLGIRDTGGSPGNGGMLMFGAFFGYFGAIKGFLQNGSGPLGAIDFYTRNGSADATLTRRMRIDFNGNIGIGTGSPDALLSVNGIASFGAGAATTPSVAAFGDLNTGMWFPAADTIALSTGGSERMRIESNGNVGIGSSTLTSTSFRVSKNLTGSTAPSGVFSDGTIQSDGTAIPTYFSGLLNTAAATFTIGNAQIYRAAVGTIGANSAITNLYGYTAAALTAGTTNYGFFASAPAANVTTGKTYYGFFEASSVATGGGTSWAFYASGTAPNYFAGQVQLGAGAVGTPSLAAFGDTNTGMWFPASDTIAWSTGGSERMRITSAGNIAIGTSSPSSRLEVTGDVANSLTSLGTGDDATVTITNSNVGGLNRIAKVLFEIANLPIVSISGAYTVFNGSNDIGGSLILSTQTNASGGVLERMRIDANGNVVVNTAAIATNATNGFLYVPSCAGTPTGTPTTYTGRVPIVVDTTNNKLYFYSGGAWRDAGP